MKPMLRKLIVPFFFVAMAWSGWVHAADPPSRVARLAYVSGTASFSPGGERDWGRAVVNRPLITGDRLWVERGARAELQLGSAAIRVGGSTSLTLLNLNDRIAQVELTQGTLNIRVRRLDRGQVFEVATPYLAYSIRRPGNYRIHVDTDGVTTVTVRSGQADVYGEGRAFLVRDRQAMRFYDSGLRDYETFASWPVDEFERWSIQRDRSWDNSPSRRYVSAELIGYQDLDQHGTWRQDREYGNVWVPNRVSADWAPYRDGHWSWVEPWGWTWVDEAQWGFAPSHYGRWAYVGNSWAWVPGPVKAQPVYAPALVAFVAGSNLQSGSGGGGAVGWFPLGPRDVYRPSYTASREYFSNVNTSNTVITQVNVTNYYDNRNTSNVTYANQQVPGAVIAVLAAAFVQSRPVARETVRVSREMVAKAPVAAVAPVAPVLASVVPPATQQIARPPERTHSRPVVAQTAPPPPPVAFAAKESALAANAGKPLDTAAVAALKPAAPASAPAVKVVQATQPVAAPAKPASAPTAAALEAAASASPRARPSAQGASAPRRSSAAAAAAQAAAPASAPATAAPASASPAAVPAREPAPAAGVTPPQTSPVPPARQAPAAAAPSAAAPGAAASAARERRGQRNEEDGGARGRPAGPAGASDPDRSKATSAAPVAPATPAAPAVPATPATPATPAARATPPAPATPAAPAAPATRATPAVPPVPAPAATPTPPPAPPARATPATPPTRAASATPVAPPAAAPSPRAQGPAEANPEDASRGRNPQARGRDAGEANRPAAAEAPRSGPPPGRAVPPVGAPAASTPPGAPAAAAPPPPAASPRAVSPPAAAPAARAASADAPAAASQRRNPKADDGAAPGRREAASEPGNADDRRRRREEERKP